MDEWERVHAIYNFYDCPREGVASFKGKPNFFKCVFDEERDDWTDEYRLVEIEPDVLALIQEGWTIWLRRSASFKRGETTIEMHPTLPADRKRFDEIQRLIGGRLEIDTASGLRMRGEFRDAGPDAANAEVRWTPL